MDGEHFDRLVARWFTSLSRRRFLTATAGSGLGALLALLAGTAFPGAVARAAEPVTSDDFAGGVIDPERWTVGSFGSGSTIAQASGRLEITFAPGANEAPDNIGVFGSWVASTCKLRGDFDIQVDYRLLDWSGASRNGVPVVLAADPPGAPQVLFAARIGPNEDAPYESYFSNIRSGGITYVPTDDLTGGLRLVRSGADAVGYYRDAGTGEWVAIENTQIGPLVTSGDATVSLWALPGTARVITEQVRVAFDNFRVNQGEFDCPGNHHGPPTDKDQCKKGGWKEFDTPRRFKNQGDCVSFVVRHQGHGNNDDNG